MTYHTVTPPLPCPYKRRAATVAQDDSFVQIHPDEWRRLYLNQGEFLSKYREGLKYGAYG